MYSKLFDLNCLHGTNRHLNDLHLTLLTRVIAQQYFGFGTY